MASPFNTGIQRVVRNIVRESKSAGHSLGLQCIPVKFIDSNFYILDIEKAAGPLVQARTVGRLIRFSAMVDRLLHWVLPNKLHIYIRQNAAPYIKKLQRHFDKETHGVKIHYVFDKNESTVSQTAIELTPPILLLLDSTWDMQMWKAVDDFRAAGGFVCAVLYDLIPFTHPDTVQEHTRTAHTTWWKQAPLHLDSVMCISQTVRDEFLRWQDQQKLAHRLTPDRVGYFYLGSELNTHSDDAQFPNIFIKNEPYFLVVGSVEPRKNHELILDAFELLWKEGQTPSLVIVGGHGWKSEAFFHRLETHPLYKKKLFLLTRTTDTELRLLYSNTASLIIASVAEGFGLPIEAFQHGTKVICSDIPVFREIAVDRAVFFDLSSSRELAKRISENLRLIPSSPATHTTAATEWLSWRESATQLFTKLITCMETTK